MLRATIQKGSLFAMAFPFSSNKNEDVPINPPESSSRSEPQLMPGEIGFDRVKKIFYGTEEGDLTREARSIISTTIGGGLMGFFIGGVLGAYKVPENFIAENQATRFTHRLEAQKALQQKFFLEFMLSGLKFGARLGMFCFIFGGSTTCINAYTGKPAIMNYTLGGALTGCLFKMNLGLKGIVSGTVVGSALGAFCGSLSMLTLYLAGVSINDIYSTQNSWFEIRNEKMRENIKAHVEKEMPIVKNMFDTNQKNKQVQAEEKTNQTA